MFDVNNSPFSAYDITEHKVLEDHYSAMSTTYGDPQEPHLEMLGVPVSTGRVIVGFIILLVSVIIACAYKVDGEYGLTSFIALVAGLVCSFAVLMYGRKAKLEKIRADQDRREKEKRDRIMHYRETHSTRFACPTCGCPLYTIDGDPGCFFRCIVCREDIVVTKVVDSD